MVSSETYRGRIIFYLPRLDSCVLEVYVSATVGRAEVYETMPSQALDARDTGKCNVHRRWRQSAEVALLQGPPRRAEVVHSPRVRRLSGSRPTSRRHWAGAEIDLHFAR